jgi:hypothetical protein
MGRSNAVVNAIIHMWTCKCKEMQGNFESPPAKLTVSWLKFNQAAGVAVNGAAAAAV